MKVYKKLAIQFVIVMATFSVFRILLLSLNYSKYFSELTSEEIVFSFFLGLRFDFSIALTVLAIPHIMMLFPLKFCERACWQSLWNYLYLAVYMVMFLFLTGDLIFFGYTGRHVFDELLRMGNNLNFFWAEIRLAYFSVTVLSLLFLLVLALIFRHFFIGLSYENPNRLEIFLFFILLNIFGIRGSLAEAPLGIMSAYLSGRGSAGQLTLNGLFTAWHSCFKGENTYYKVYKKDELKAALKPLDIAPDDEHPFYGRVKARSRDYFNLPKTDKPINIVIIVLESFGSYYVDSFGGHGFGVTPNLDKIAREGIMFTNFFAPGFYTPQAVQSILLSVPSIKDLKSLGTWFHSSKAKVVGKIFQDMGYETFFAQSDPKESLHFDLAAESLGFRHIFGMKDYPVLLNYPPQPEPVSGWDYEMFMFMLERMKESKKPFFTFMLTGTTHTPYAIPPKPHNILHSSNNETGFLNAMSYTDEAVGEFFKKSREESWFKNTLFFITADHAYLYRKYDSIEQHRIPLILYSPYMIKKSQKSRLSSQLDILPTILDIVEYKDQISTAGRSLATTKGEPFVFLDGFFGPPAIIMKDHYLRYFNHGYREFFSISGRGFQGDDDKLILEKCLLGYYQILYESLLENKWF
ncbi:MAG: LTA synthase family protein [Oligoflexales bacterium]|nr:LTA synthase family protein [Oligoflexales bacterium]